MVSACVNFRQKCQLVISDAINFHLAAKVLVCLAKKLIDGSVQLKHIYESRDGLLASDGGRRE